MTAWAQDAVEPEAEENNADSAQLDSPQNAETETQAGAPGTPPIEGSEAAPAEGMDRAAEPLTIIDPQCIGGIDFDGAPCEPRTLPEVDAPAGDGFMAQAADSINSLLSLVEAGGPVIIILAALSVIALGIILVKLIQFAFLRVGRRGFVDRVVALARGGETDQALGLLNDEKGSLARVMEAAVRGRALAVRTGTSEQVVREEVTRVAQSKLDGLESGLTFLSLIATLSPLLGLLGTVLGMIEAFQQLQAAGGNVDPTVLSGGIWEALLTTAAGLTVAIPASACYTWLQRTVDSTAEHMEDAATQVFTADLYGAVPSAPEAGSETGTA